ncbi:NERD domain-containing protein [Agrobacterium pusense]|uniref:nuclease-related domain-containing DEAD/DEAH box helicase n=1 Tax=Agrobacterium pusense TaxID=648995 RepID=UPI0035A6B932
MAKKLSYPVAGYDHDSEIKVYRAFLGLEDDWIIIHSVGWLGKRDKRIGDGEADFVLIHPSYGIVVVEVKGGGVLVENGRWTSEDRYGRINDIKDPFEQASASKSTLYKWLKDRLGFFVPTCHVVAFPDISPLPEIGPAAPREIILDARDLQNPSASILRAIAHWKQSADLSTEQIKKICAALAPTVVVKRTLADEAHDTEAGLIKLTDEQVRAFQLTRRTPRAVVFGGAGTGKTILACEKARQLRNEGHRVLLTCYNELLSRTLAADATLHDIRVTTFHSLCLSLAKAASIPDARPSDAAWWTNDAPLLLIDAAEKTGTRFDAIVVDEGQDFTQVWIDALEAICSGGDASPFYVFADENQTLWSRDWIPDAKRLRLDLQTNCRNSRPIAERVAAVAGLVVNDIGVVGPAPKWTELSSPKDGPRLVQRLVERLLDERFEARHVVVLCEDPSLVKRLCEMAVADTGFCGFGGQGVVVETIARFKGLEALAVVLVLDGPIQEKPDRVAYVGLSRAKSYLNVVGRPERRHSIGWLI